jgi:hypothetical protein
MEPLLRTLNAPLSHDAISDDFRCLHDNARLFAKQLESVREALGSSQRIPLVRTQSGAIVPRVLALAEGFLAATTYQFSEQNFTAYVEAFQESTVLKMGELWLLVSAIKLVLLEEVAIRGSGLLADRPGTYGLAACVRSLREVGETSWEKVLEPLILFDRVLHEDPAGAYPRMDFDSHDLYRQKLAEIADRSDCTEIEVANEVLKLARMASRQTDSDPRLVLRRSHVGFYLVAEGSDLLQSRVGFRPAFGQRIQSFLRKHPEEFYLSGAAVLTFAVMSVITLLLTDPYSSPGLVFLSMLTLLFPSSQSAIQVMNYLTTSLLRAQILPKLDFSEGVPDDCVTLVAVPTLLLSTKQVRKLVDDLEVRFLGNHDRNVHFLLLTDLADSRPQPQDEDPLVDLCSELIRGLNEKYAGQGMGSFFLLHRHRVYNPREKAWMGWERKRGKLMDLNKLLRHQYDNFPIKVGETAILSRVRFVITLDADTELPRGSAHRMIGALSHPLNQAIMDVENNIVVAGYGILQPRVGVSVQSTSRSRLASLYSGETGLDIYTHAVSDVYQDLFGEANFVGKGIYEVDALHSTLDRRFPCNALLSHDLVEGAYARAGLASDIEVIEDYPSHYSAYNRRKHRWLRGDWQITSWLFRLVPDQSGRYVNNPISLISRWKILDNLRRSLVEPATLLLFVLGWIALPGKPIYWTLAAIAILVLPAFCQLAFGLVQGVVTLQSAIAQDAVNELFAAMVNVFLTLTFLAHQTLLSIDAVVRTLVRRIVTWQRLLQWETAAEAEAAGSPRTPLDTYLDWTPAMALGLGLLVWLVRPSALLAALPILMLWTGSKLVSRWLNQPPRAQRKPLSARDERLLRLAGLRTWRYFAHFTNEEHNWLVPDNVQEQPYRIAARVSPTNLGLLLNARQVACEFGYLTVPEFAQQTLQTLATISALQRYRGHLLNWYDTRSLKPISPALVSSVDSGNFLASLWTVKQGCQDLLQRPLLSSSVARGFLEHLEILVDLRACSRRRLSALRRETREQNWLTCLLNLPGIVCEEALRKAAKSKCTEDAQWFAEQAQARIENLKRMVSSHIPWLLAEFAVLWDDPQLNLQSAGQDLALEQIPGFVDSLTIRIGAAVASATSEQRKSLYQRLQTMLPDARANSVRLIHDLRTISSQAGTFADEMDFRFLLNERRKLLSVGFDVESQQVYSACYDLLATESRTAVFVAIAKEDIPQESWFQLGRAHTQCQGHPVLLSWSGTMFEYLMPLVWMHSYPNTLLERTSIAAVRCQQAFGSANRVPWGISESAYFKMDEADNYQYYAFGIPHLALHRAEPEGIVVSPYSTFLALPIDPCAALRNLRTMKKKGWQGAYGFYDAADFSPSRRRSPFHRQELVRCWMAHHQGMSLLSIANFLHDGVVQRWFHSDPRAQATELLLQEKPATHTRTMRLGFGKSAA